MLSTDENTSHGPQRPLRGDALEREASDWRENPGAVRPYFYGHDLVAARASVASLNASRGLTERDVDHIVTSSMAAQFRGERAARARDLDEQREARKRR